MNLSTRLARSLVIRVIEAGVTDIVISPGSRSASLALAFYQAEKKGLLAINVRIDERTAAFLALGIAKASKKPVAILCTSGTAVANYHPAILEARHSHIPLLVLTADRPSRLRQTGANQTTIQSGIFGSATPCFADIWDESQDLSPLFKGLLFGPVHINLQFDEPLLPDDESDWLAGVRSGAWVHAGMHTEDLLEIKKTRGAVVIGHDRGGFDAEEVEEFSAKTGWPVIAEDPLSFPHAIAHSSLFLSSEKVRTALHPEVVVVIGRTTLSRSTNALIKSADVEVVVDPRISDVDARRSGDLLFSSLPKVKREIGSDESWLRLWEKYSYDTDQLIDEKLSSSWSEPQIAKKFAESLQNGTTVYIASSRPVRDIEAFAAPRDGVEVFANRGLAGIDGNVSTAVGIASQRSGTVAIMGDLSFLHDITAFVGSSDVDLRILVINNDGGGIFSTLPQYGVDGFEKLFGTPHRKDLESIAKALGVPTESVAGMDDLLLQMSKPIVGISVVIAHAPSRDTNAILIRSISSAIEKF